MAPTGPYPQLAGPLGRITCSPWSHGLQDLDKQPFKPLFQVHFVFKGPKHGILKAFLKVYFD